MNWNWGGGGFTLLSCYFTSCPSDNLRYTSLALSQNNQIRMLEASPNISQNIHHRILARGSRGHVCGLSMAACRNGGLTRAASIPRVTCVARPSLPYHSFLICPSDNHMLHSGRPLTARPGAGPLPNLLPRRETVTGSGFPRGPIVNFPCSNDHKGPSSPLYHPFTTI